MTEPQIVPFFDGLISYSPGRIFDARSYASGGAGMVGTADAYLKFLEMVRTGGGNVLRPSSAASMGTNQIGNLEAGQPGGSWGFGFGFGVLKKPDATMPSPAGTLPMGRRLGRPLLHRSQREAQRRRPDQHRRRRHDGRLPRRPPKCHLRPHCELIRFVEHEAAP